MRLRDMSQQELLTIYREQCEKYIMFLKDPPPGFRYLPEFRDIKKSLNEVMEELRWRAANLSL